MKKTKIIIIGNGPAGTTVASKIRQLDKICSIHIFSLESLPYYARPKLPDYICGKTDNLQVYAESWYKDHNIKLHLDSKVQTIDVAKKTILSNNTEYSYNTLLLATGALPNKPPVSGSDNKNIFTLRTLDDARNIINALKDKKEITVVGGGVLGLEIASTFASMGNTTKVIETGHYLLNRQLNETQGKKLQSAMEQLGITFYLKEMCDSIIDDKNKIVIKTKNNTLISSDIIVLSVGVKADIDLAKKAGLTVDKGIVVNEYMQTSNPDIFAAGDCIQFDGQLWGFIKSSIEQGNIVASNIIKPQSAIYAGTKIDVTVKISGIDMKEILN
ncbi:MAG: hypothetical protein A2Y40_04910 [Candidatus Margulisbacteria bacterium GWF2_35_9]|nr:MAG: hypothetical protein A2Y40_04910 [Candidatus Margulisbacteria bacterium GWF2_35_9]